MNSSAPTTTTTTPSTNPFGDDSNNNNTHSSSSGADFGIYNDDVDVNNVNHYDNDNDNGNDCRRGTISSARFNILSTMVGGGCLSLPLAFVQSGNALVGPFMLIVTGLITDFCFRLLVATAHHLDQQQQQQSQSHNDDEDDGPTDTFSDENGNDGTNRNNDRQQQQQPPQQQDYTNLPPGKHTFESVTCAAFGPKAYVFSMTLVVLMCFFGAVGYSVLLRDMMEPINDIILHRFFDDHGGHNSTTNSTTPVNDTNTNSYSYNYNYYYFDNIFIMDYDHHYGEEDPTKQPQQLSWFHKNLTLFMVILLVTPFCTLRHLTALKDCGAASMTSVLILGSCIVFRSIQCNINGGAGNPTTKPWYTYLTFFPTSWRELLDAVPLYISCFVCHYNILPVQNELQNPTPKRVSWWLRSTTWFAVGLYMVMGFAGSSYAHCTSTGTISGNILLDFDENDPLLFVGRMCLAVTITLAFPMLVIPARDIMIRSWISPMLSKWKKKQQRQHPNLTTNGDAAGAGGALETLQEEGTATAATTQDDLQEPLLQGEEPSSPNGNRNGGEGEDEDESVAHISFLVLLITSIVIFWTAGAVASCVESIDIVWDLLGSSLSILLSYLIPAGTYLVVTNRSSSPSSTTSAVDKWSRVACWGLILFFFPLMMISTANAVMNTFF